jgi:hypothetical protein
MAAGIIGDDESPPLNASRIEFVTLLDHFTRHHFGVLFRLFIPREVVTLRVWDKSAAAHNIEKISTHL